MIKPFIWKQIKPAKDKIRSIVLAIASVHKFDQERMKVREVIPHIGPIPIVIPLKLFLDLPRDPVSQEG